MKSRLVVCVDNDDFEASLERRKIYQLIDDPEAEAEGLLRVVDESGEDYLYPSQMFEPVELSETVTSTLFFAAG